MLFIDVFVLTIGNSCGVLIQWCSVVSLVDIVLLSVVKISVVFTFTITDLVSLKYRLPRRHGDTAGGTV